MTELLEKGLTHLITWIGIPGILSLTLWCVRKCNTYTKQLIILMKAQKAQMRAQLLKDYGLFMERKYILQVELDEWLNQYDAYHELVGNNAVLDNRKEDLINLPPQPPQQPPTSN